MIEILQAAILGVVQGLTEFLPISSSGHLIIFPKIFGWAGALDSLEFDVALHVGTTIAVIWFFWADWVRIISSFIKNLGKGIKTDFDSKLFLMILVGSIPAAIVGFGFKDFIESKTREPLLVATTLLAFALVLFAVDRIGSKKREFRRIDWPEAIFVGIAQAISLIPGVSRSGVTISAGLARGLDRQAAARFSFLLSTPVILGAAILSTTDLFRSSSQGNLIVIMVGTIAAAVSGWLAIKFLLKYVATNNFNIFVWYRIALAVFLVFLFLNK
ncbi:MAG TPA: undecaprenyl-diphosphatase UppP [Candidatus Nanoarchaeia archaeon]